MPTPDKSFQDLLAEAPMGQEFTSRFLYGGLARTAESSTFLLNLADGSSLTLPTAAVKSHTVVSSSFGQPIVQVELDTKALSTEQLAAVPFALQTPHHISAETLAGVEAITNPNIVSSSLHGVFDKTPAADGTYPVYINGHKLIHVDS